VILARISLRFHIVKKRRTFHSIYSEIVPVLFIRMEDRLRVELSEHMTDV
jgi:hypothetical protein